MSPVARPLGDVRVHGLAMGMSSSRYRRGTARPGRWAVLAIRTRCHCGLVVGGHEVVWWGAAKSREEIGNGLHRDRKLSYLELSQAGLS